MKSNLLTLSYLRDKFSFFELSFIQIRVIYPINFKNFMKSTTTKLRLICEFPFMNMPLRRLTGLVAALSIFMGIDVVADPVLITEKVNDSAPYGILETTPDAWWADSGETNWNIYDYTWSSYGNNHPAPPNPPWGAQKMLFTSSQTGALTQLKFDHEDYRSPYSTRGVEIKVTNETTGANVSVTIDPKEHGAGNYAGGGPYNTGTNTEGMTLPGYQSGITPNAPFLIFKFNLPVSVGDEISMYPENDGELFAVGANLQGATYISGVGGDNRFNKHYMWEARSHFLKPEAYQQGVDVTYSLSHYHDTTAPVITLTGDATISLLVGETYTEAGATAEDTVDGDITDSLVISGAVNTSAVGVYSVNYNVSDAAENDAVQVTRTVNVVAPTVKNAHEIQIDANTNIALDSTVGDVGGLWPWYSNSVAGDPSNSLSVFLEGVRDADTHRMNHNTSNPGSLGQTSGTGTSNYSYTGIPGGGNDVSAKGVVLKYTATEERELLIETTGGDYNDSVVVIFTEAHLNGGFCSVQGSDNG